MSAVALLSTLSLLGAQPDPEPVVLAYADQAVAPSADGAAPDGAAPPATGTPGDPSAPADAAPADVADDAASGPPLRVKHAPGDPLEGFNRTMFSLNLSLDKAIFRPAAMGYKHVVPKPARTGIRNVFISFTEPVVFLNDILQLRPKAAARTLLRTLINTIFGLGGLIDVAKHEGLPHRDNGLGNTLGRYGVKPGPYLFLPFIGPSTLRDATGWQADSLVLPLTVGQPFDRIDYQVGKTAILGIDARAEADAQIKTLFDTALDPYATLRSIYLQSRAADIAALKGKSSETEGNIPFDDPLDDPVASPDSAASPAPAAGAAPPQ